MNERIKQLAEKSGFFPVPDDTEWDWEYRAENARYENFAWLVVEECQKEILSKTNISIVKPDGYSAGIIDSVAAIKDLFK